MDKARRPVALQKRDPAGDLSVVWSIHNLCNLSCSYCPPYNSSATETWLKKENVFRFLDDLHRHYVENLGYRQIRFSLTGGEPTLWKDLPAVAERMAELGMSLGLTSNGTIPAARWQPFISRLDWVCLSFHPEGVKEEIFFDLLRHFHDRADTTLPAVRFMMHPAEPLWNKCLNFAERMKGAFDNWAMEFVRIQNDFGEGLTPVEYSPAQLRFLGERGYQEQRRRPELIRQGVMPKMMDITYDNGDREQLRENDLINADLIWFRGWNCHIGLESLMIHPTGKIARAGCGVGGEIGSLQQTGGFHFPQAPVQCERDRCWCASEVTITKHSREFALRDNA